MKSKKLTTVPLRALRKTSHLSGKAAKKSSHFMDRVERKTTRLIVEQTGSPTAHDSVAIDLAYYDAFPQLTPIHPALPTLGQRPSVTVFAFLDPKGFYGGIATLLCVGATLANKLGYDLRIAQTTGFSKDTDVLGFLASKGIDIAPERFSTVDLSKRSPYNYAYLPLHQDDVVVVSAWWDAHIASQLPLSSKFLYLIQDYEPIFYNNSDQSVLADQTYHSEKFLPICNTELLYKFFVEQGYSYIEKYGTWFEPAPAPPIAKRKGGHNGPRRMFLYGRPQVHRNLFFNAIKAIDIAFQDKRLRDQDWEIYCAGSAGVPSVRLSSGHIIKNMGKMGVEEYYDWASSIDVAVSPMLAPHPNYPTLELASLGAMVVSTKWKTKQNLDRYSPNILMADPSAESMAQHIIQASLTKDAERLENIKKNNIGDSWTKALDGPLDKIAKTYKKRSSPSS